MFNLGVGICFFSLSLPIYLLLSDVTTHKVVYWNKQIQLGDSFLVYLYNLHNLEMVSVVSPILYLMLLMYEYVEVYIEISVEE